MELPVFIRLTHVDEEEPAASIWVNVAHIQTFSQTPAGGSEIVLVTAGAGAETSADIIEVTEAPADILYAIRHRIEEGY